MTSLDTRKWYKKKRYIIPTILGAVLLLNASGSQTNTTTPTPVVRSYQEQTTKVETVKVVNPKTTNTYVPTTSGLSNDNYYTNTAGNTVHSPAYSNSVPAGASARCRDGTYSFSQSRRGTCSHHGGVASWL
jgi:hypothetical protein